MKVFMKGVTTYSRTVRVSTYGESIAKNLQTQVKSSRAKHRLKTWRTCSFG